MLKPVLAYDRQLCFLRGALQTGTVHPADSKYAELKADLNVVDPSSDEYSMISTYLQVSLGTCQQCLQ